MAKAVIIKDMTTKEIIPFSYEGKHEVRTVMDGDGGLWFVAKDVCDVLDIVNPTQAVNQLFDDEKMLDYVLDSSGQRRKSYFINEPGLYSLVTRSSKPEAKVFKRWITHEVIHQIRKTGSYGTPAMTQTEIIAAIATNAAEQEKKTRLLEVGSCCILIQTLFQKQLLK